MARSAIRQAIVTEHSYLPVVSVVAFGALAGIVALRCGVARSAIHQTPVVDDGHLPVVQVMTI